MIDHIVNPPIPVELSAVLVGGLSGAAFAVRKNFVITGVIVLAISTGLGGGMVRDVLLGQIPVALLYYRYLLTVLIAIAIGFFFTRAVHHAQPVLNVVDALGLGLFAVIGAQKALNAGLPMLSAIFLGAITSTGGWALRDVLSGETPELVLPGPIYGLAALLGSITYVLLVAGLGTSKLLAEGITLFMTVIVRLLALKKGINAPFPVDLIPKRPKKK